jgi:hypothetical protein
MGYELFNEEKSNEKTSNEKTSNEKTSNEEKSNVKTLNEEIEMTEDEKYKYTCPISQQKTCYGSLNRDLEKNDQINNYFKLISPFFTICLLIECCACVAFGIYLNIIYSIPTLECDSNLREYIYSIGKELIILATAQIYIFIFIVISKFTIETKCNFYFLALFFLGKFCIGLFNYCLIYQFSACFYSMDFYIMGTISLIMCVTSFFMLIKLYK